MGSIVASELITEARRRLQDESNVAERWSDEVLLRGLNEGQVVLVTIKHDANTLREAVALEPGTRQSLPDNSVAFIRLNRNMGEDGETPGRAISGIEQTVMDMADPAWHTSPNAKEVIHYLYDDRDERGFFVWPPVDNGHVELVHAARPTPIADNSSVITLEDSYAPALICYMVYYGLSQDGDSAPNRELASGWFTTFGQLVAGKVQSEEALRA